MKRVLVDTSGFYPQLDGTDPFHAATLQCLQRAEAGGPPIVTTNNVIHEIWSRIQRRQGWAALEVLLLDLLPCGEIVSVGPAGAPCCRRGLLPRDL